MTARSFKSPLILIPLLFLTGNIAAQGVPEDVRQSIISTNKEIEKAALAGEFVRQFDYFTDDAIIDHPLEPPVKGRAALLAAAERMRKADVKYQSMGGDIEDMWMCGDKVYERGTWAMSSISKNRKQPVAAYGSYFQIWRKTSQGRFKIQYLIFTLDFNPYEFGR